MEKLEKIMNLLERILCDSTFCDFKAREKFVFVILYFIFFIIALISLPFIKMKELYDEYREND